MHDFVAELAMSGSSLWFRPGRVIIQEGDPKCDEMYVLLKGAVEVTACGEFLGRLENDIFGEIGLLDLLERRTANITAATTCHCIVFTRQIVIPVLAKYPDARMRLLEHARQRLIALNQSVGAGQGHSTGIIRLPGCAIGFGSAFNSDDANLFAANPIFQDVRADLLHDISSHMTTKKYDESKTIFEEGAPCTMDKDYVYWIAKGQVEIWKGGHFVTTLSEGDVFGEIAVLQQLATQQSTAKSKTPVVLRIILGKALMQAMQKFEDESLNDRWEDEMARRTSQLNHKAQLNANVQINSSHVDFMFLKMSYTDQDGKRVIKNDSVGRALKKKSDLCLEDWDGFTFKPPPTLLPSLIPGR